MAINYKALSPFVQPGVVDDYNKWLKKHPTVMLTSSTLACEQELVFTCRKCGNKGRLDTLGPDNDLNNALNMTDWECGVCTGDGDSRRFGMARTVMVRLN